MGSYALDGDTVYFSGDRAAAYERLALIPLHELVDELDSPDVVRARVQVEHVSTGGDQDLFVGVTDGVASVAGSWRDNDLFMGAEFGWSSVDADTSATSPTIHFLGDSDAFPAAWQSATATTVVDLAEECSAASVHSDTATATDNASDAMDQLHAVHPGTLYAELVAGDAAEVYGIQGVCVQLEQVQTNELVTTVQLDVGKGVSADEVEVVAHSTGLEVTSWASKQAICGALGAPLFDDVAVSWSSPDLCDLRARDLADEADFDTVGAAHIGGSAPSGSLSYRNLELRENTTFEMVEHLRRYTLKGGATMDLRAWGLRWPGGDPRSATDGFDALGYSADPNVLGAFQPNLEITTTGTLRGRDYTCTVTVEHDRFQPTRLQLATASAGAESCDGVDNDLDGTVDEDC